MRTFETWWFSARTLGQVLQECNGRMTETSELLRWKKASALEFTPYYLPFLANSFWCWRTMCLGHCVLSGQLVNCSKKWETMDIIFMEVTAPAIIWKTVDASFYLNAAFSGEVLKNEIIKEGKRGPLRSQTGKYCTEKIKIGLNMPSQLKIMNSVFLIGDILFFSSSHSFHIYP